MALVRYIAHCSKFSIYLSLKGGEVKLQFEGKNAITKERFADISDPEIQQALESSKDFNVYFTRSTEFDWAKEETKIADNVVVIPAKVTMEDKEVKQVKVVTIPTVDNLSTLEPVEFEYLMQAKSWLVKAKKQVITPKIKLTEVIELAKKLGYDLKIVKK